ncbi:hypothetical protein ES707_06472 [subsurface metagenome]
MVTLYKARVRIDVGGVIGVAGVNIPFQGAADIDEDFCGTALNIAVGDGNGRRSRVEAKAGSDSNLVGVARIG